MEGTLKAFVHYPANTWPGQTEELKDDTHFNAYGAYELARCVVEAIRTQGIGLEKWLRIWGSVWCGAVRPGAAGCTGWVAPGRRVRSGGYAYAVWAVG